MPEKTHLTIDTHDEDRGVLVLGGDLDSHSCQTLDQRLAGASLAAPLVLDMSAVRFVDSSGLRALLAAHSARLDAAPLIIRDPSRAVWRLLEITSLTDHLNVQGGPPAVHGT